MMLTLSFSATWSPIASTTIVLSATRCWRSSFDRINERMKPTVVEDITALLAAEPGISTVWHFASQSTGRAGCESHMDIGISQRCRISLHEPLGEVQRRSADRQQSSLDARRATGDPGVLFCEDTPRG